MHEHAAHRLPRIILGLVTFASAGYACADVTLYQHDDYRGRSQSIDGDTSSLLGTGFNDVASSVVVDHGIWELCRDVDFHGQCTRLEPGRYPSLREMGLNDQVSSLRRVGRGPGGGHGRSDGKVVLYQHDRYGGRAVPIDDATGNLKSIDFNDTASSVVINRGHWELCTDANYRGRCERLEPGRYSSLGSMGMNDQLSSLRQVGRGGDGGGRRERIVLYEHNDYGGRSLPIGGVTSNLKWEDFNDVTSSLVIRRGTWELCTDSDFRGRCEIFAPGRYPALKEMGLNDKVSSVRQVGRGSGGRGYDGRYEDEGDEE